MLRRLGHIRALPPGARRLRRRDVRRARKPPENPTLSWPITLLRRERRAPPGAARGCAPSPSSVPIRQSKSCGSSRDARPAARLAVTMQSERGLQAAEACVLYRVSEFPDSFFDSLNGEWRYAFGLFGTVAAGGRFCGLKAALRSPPLHRYGLVRTLPTRSRQFQTSQCEASSPQSFPPFPSPFFCPPYFSAIALSPAARASPASENKKARSPERAVSKLSFCERTTSSRPS